MDPYILGATVQDLVSMATRRLGFALLCVSVVTRPLDVAVMYRGMQLYHLDGNEFEDCFSSLLFVSYFSSSSSSSLFKLLWTFGA